MAIGHSAAWPKMAALTSSHAENSACGPAGLEAAVGSIEGLGLLAVAAVDGKQRRAVRRNREADDIYSMLSRSARKINNSHVLMAAGIIGGAKSQQIAIVGGNHRALLSFQRSRKSL
jgi:hypothetical protein